MKTEKIMQEVMKAIELSEISETIKKFMVEEPDLFNEKSMQTYENVLAKLYLDLKEDLRKEINKQGKAPAQAKIIDKMIKNMSKDDNLLGYIQNGEKFCFSDGHRIFYSDDNFGYKKCKNQFDVSKIGLKYDKEFSVNVEDLKMFIKENGLTLKKECKPYRINYEYVETLIAFNHIYLLDAINYSGSNTFSWLNRRNPAIQLDNNYEKLTLTLPMNVW